MSICSIVVMDCKKVLAAMGETPISINFARNNGILPECAYTSSLIWVGAASRVSAQRFLALNDTHSGAVAMGQAVLVPAYVQLSSISVWLVKNASWGSRSVIHADLFLFQKYGVADPGPMLLPRFGTHP